MTFVTVGNMRRSFSRLLDAVSAIMTKLPQPVIIQYGHTPFSCEGCKAVQFMDMSEFEMVLESAELLIMHAGGGSVIHAIHAGKVPVVVPRLLKYSEHIDNHQVELARTLGSTGKVVSVENTVDLEVAISKALEKQKKNEVSSSMPKMLKMVEETLNSFAVEMASIRSRSLRQLMPLQGITTNSLNEKRAKPVVVLERLKTGIDLNSMKNQFTRSFEHLFFHDNFNKANAVLIKPNLTYPVYKKGVTTRIEFIESLVAALRGINSKTTIYIGEGDGGYNSFSITDAFKNKGFFDLERKYPRVKIINLSKMPSQEVKIDTAKGICAINLPQIFFDEIDFSISCPVPKVHCMTVISLSYKNQWGCIPDTMRLKDHYILNHIVSKISDILKFRYAFLDGKYGLNGNGPMVGEPVELNWFAASNSLGAFDAVVSEMMGFDWGKIKHLKMAGEYGFIPKKEDIYMVGDIDSLKRKFILKRDYWNYPALVAFNSKSLTNLVYFSKLAKPIHDVMYFFRKRAIE